MTEVTIKIVILVLVVTLLVIELRQKLP